MVCEPQQREMRLDRDSDIHLVAVGVGSNVNPHRHLKHDLLMGVEKPQLGENPL